jgi:hypothetical protein
MATTSFFDKTLNDQAGEAEAVHLAFGRMNATGEDLLYFQIDGKIILVDKTTGREICSAMELVASYLGY